MSDRLTTRPIPLKRAQRFVAQIHRRLPRVVGGMWSVCALRGEAIVGVAIVGRPSARLSDAEGDLAPTENLEVTRVAVREGDRSSSGNKGACSILYAACARAGRAMGAANMFTYTHGDENGASLHAAGWYLMGSAGGGEWDRDDRPRQASLDPEEKHLWYAPWSAAVQANEARRIPDAEAFR